MNRAVDPFCPTLSDSRMQEYWWPDTRGLQGAVLSLLSFGLHSLALPATVSRLLVLTFVAGALWQVGSGVAIWRKGNFWGAVFLIPTGLFLLSLFSLIIVPEFGWGRGPGTSAMASYFTIWTIFNLAIFSGVGRCGRFCRLPVGLMTAFCILMAGRSLLPGGELATIVAWEAVVSGAVFAGVTCRFGQRKEKNA